MRRPNIHLSDGEQAALDVRAAVEGSNRSDVLRNIVDRELNLSRTDGSVDGALADAADEIAAAARAIVAGDTHLTSG